jgi:hypothetical protein
MSIDFRWNKLKRTDEASVETLLRANEHKYVSACAKYLIRRAVDPVWVLRRGKEEIAAIVINYGSTLLPVLCGKKDIPMPGFSGDFFCVKKIHSVQGLTEDVIIIDEIIQKMGRKNVDRYDYDLMSLDGMQKTESKDRGSDFSNLVLRVPNLSDIDKIAPLQAGYEKEEVLPKGGVFSPAASRVNIARIIAGGQILAAELNGRMVGKINLNAISFTRCQVGGVYVHPDYRSKGIARKMTAEFIASFVNQGKGITLFVKKNNIPACKLYTNMGFIKQNDYRITYY